MEGGGPLGEDKAQEDHHLMVVDPNFALSLRIQGSTSSGATLSPWAVLAFHGPQFSAAPCAQIFGLMLLLGSAGSKDWVGPATSLLRF